MGVGDWSVHVRPWSESDHSKRVRGLFVEAGGAVEGGGGGIIVPLFR